MYAQLSTGVRCNAGARAKCISQRTYSLTKIDVEFAHDNSEDVAAATNAEALLVQGQTHRLTTALYLEEAARAQGVQGIHSIQVVGGYVLRKSELQTSPVVPVVGGCWGRVGVPVGCGVSAVVGGSMLARILLGKKANKSKGQVMGSMHEDSI
ncbi:MAG: hypothetical protein FRX49_03403 [Trebouxia sp. A1-2]|nr:MAG: hypothetical protein FRX49_03403 [Trebouxia sp. A1-2]